MNGTRRLFELLVLGGCAVVVSGALLPLIFDPGRTGPEEGNPAWRLLLAVSYLAVALVLLPWYRETLFVLRLNWSLVSLLVLALLSSLWADTPGLVLQRSIGLLGTTLLGVALAVRVSFEEQLRLLSWLFRVVAFLSIAFIVLFPSYGISKEGEWMGVFGYKNALGTGMGLALLVEWQLPAVGRFSKVLKGLATLLYAFLLLKSDSITPAVAIVVTLIFISIYKFAALRLRVPLYAVFLIVAAVVSFGLSLIVANSDWAMGLLGRSSNLTGRTEIWSLVIAFIPQRPILGYGYSGFWLGASPESFVVNRVIGGPVMYSHNGYLEIFLNLGVIGFLLTLVFIATGMKRAFSLSRQHLISTSLWPLVFLVYFILHNIGECTLMMQSLEWALCVSCIAGTDPLLFACTSDEEAELPLVPLEEPR